ncbi:hypothetical protein Tco_1189354, partial [Tanacetum coccineum]
MRVQTNTKTHEDLCSQRLEMVSQAIHDVVITHQVTESHHFMTASVGTDSNADLEESSYDGIDRSKPDQFTQFRFSSLTEEEGCNRIEEYVQYQDDLWDEASPSMNASSISDAMQPTLR